jgi:DNA repair protein RecO (recombination protein O)
MGESVQTEAIVLRGSDVGEEDRILTILTRELGLVRAAAGGAKSIRKGRAAALDLFVHSRLEVYTSSKAGRMQRIRASEAINPFLALRQDYDNVCCASYMAELLSRTTQEGDPAPELFDLLRDCLEQLESGRERNLVLLIFIMRTLLALGMAPELENCLKCGLRVDGEGVLDNFAGGLLHQECLTGPAGDRVLSGDGIAMLRFIVGKPLERVWNLAMRPDESELLFRLLGSFAHHHLGFVPRTVKSLPVRPADA